MVHCCSTLTFVFWRFFGVFKEWAGWILRTVISPFSEATVAKIHALRFCESFWVQLLRAFEYGFQGISLKPSVFEWLLLVSFWLTTSQGTDKFAICRVNHVDFCGFYFLYKSKTLAKNSRYIQPNKSLFVHYLMDRHLFNG